MVEFKNSYLRFYENETSEHTSCKIPGIVFQGTRNLIRDFMHLRVSVRDILEIFQIYPILDISMTEFEFIDMLNFNKNILYLFSINRNRLLICEERYPDEYNSKVIEIETEKLPLISNYLKKNPTTLFLTKMNLALVNIYSENPMKTRWDLEEMARKIISEMEKTL